MLRTLSILFLALAFVVIPYASCLEAAGSLVPAGQWISDTETRLTLAWLLSLEDDAGSLREADSLLTKVREDEPGNTRALITHVPVLLKLGRTREALELAAYVSGLEPENQSAQLLLADVHSELGHFGKCREIYRSLLEQNAGDSEFIKRYTDRLNLWGEFYTVEKFYRAQFDRDPEDKETQLRLARVLYAQQRYEEALAQLRPLESDLEVEARNHSREAALLIADVRTAQKEYNKAIATLTKVLEQNPAFYQAALAKGDVLLLEGKPEQAATIFFELTQKKPPSSLMSRAWLGYGQALLKQGDTNEAFAALRRAAELSPNAPLPKLYLLLAQGTEPSSLPGKAGEKLSPKTLVSWAGALAQINEREAAVACNELALQKDPKYFPARIGLARTLATLNRFQQALAGLEELRKEFPESDTLLLDQARVHAWAKQYDRSLDLYAQLHRRNPEDPVPRREAARTAYWGKMPYTGGVAYSNLYTPEVDDSLISTEASVPEQVASLFHTESDTLFGEFSEHPPYEAYEALQRALPTLQGALKEEAQAALEEAAPEYRLQKGAYLEHASKHRVWNRRFIPAMRSLEELIEHEPGNEEALFDLAQAQCSLGLCGREKRTYERLLHISPTHNLAGYALERHRIRSNPAVGTRFQIWDEEGYGDLAQVTRAETELRIEIPVTCQTRVSVGSHGFLDHPKRRGKTRRAYGQSVAFSSIVNEYVGVSGELMAKWYDGAPDSTLTGRVGTSLNIEDFVRLEFGYRRSEQFANAFAMDDDIEADRVSAKASSLLVRRLEVSLGYEHVFFTDDNDMRVVTAGSKVLLSDHPRTLSLQLDLEHRHTSEENIFIYTGPVLTNIVHPYWAPRHYLSAGATLEWRHDISEFFFCGSQQHYYDLKYSMGTDTDNNPYIRAAAAWHWEFLEHWIWDIEAMVHHSDQWKARFLSAGLSYRF